MKQFKAPKRTLGELDADAAAHLIAAAADLALVIDAKGVIRDVAFGSDELERELDAAGWSGRPWAHTVTVESRPKVESMLRDAAAGTPARWRQLNHPHVRGADVPVLYTVAPLGDSGRLVAFGRDLGAVSALQQRLVEAQQAMERDYRRLHQAETRYRVLFQMASEAVLIVDAANQKVVEANPAAEQLLSKPARPLVGRTFPEGFDVTGMQAIQALLARVRGAGRSEEVRARLGDGKQDFSVSAALFRQDNAALFLVRLSPQPSRAPGPIMPATVSSLVALVESAPDAMVVTGADGRVLAANRAFLELAQLATEELARGESLDRWLGRPGVDLNVLTANLRQHGVVRLFATTMRGEYGSTADVEISAAAAPHGEETCFGFTIRNVGARLRAESPTGRELPRSVEQLAGLVGRVSLKDLVREATDVIERLCIEAALELTGDNRASAAEMLGLSRQSLYVKLRRYGLGDLAPEAQE